MYTLLCVLVYVVACICVTVFVLYVIREEIRRIYTRLKNPKSKKERKREEISILKKKDDRKL